MNTQNILRSYSYKLDIILDSSELFDFELVTYYDEMDHVDIVLDYSENYDFELTNGFDKHFDEPISLKPVITIVNLEDYRIVTVDGFKLLTQSGEMIQYQY